MVERMISREMEQLEEIQIRQDELLRSVRKLEMEITETSFSLLIIREIRELQSIQERQDELLLRVRKLEVEWDGLKIMVSALKSTSPSSSSFTDQGG
jgi:hypothetical protein